MADTQSMLRAIINGQSSMKEELLSRINKLEKETKDGFKRTDENFVKVNKRIDKLGSDLAYLEDDAPTRDEHDKLEKRTTKLEQKPASV